MAGDSVAGGRLELPDPRGAYQVDEQDLFHELARVRAEHQGGDS
jgi:hypothetical protein